MQPIIALLKFSSQRRTPHRFVFLVASVLLVVRVVQLPKPLALKYSHAVVLLYSRPGFIHGCHSDPAR